VDVLIRMSRGVLSRPVERKSSANPLRIAWDVNSSQISAHRTMVSAKTTVRGLARLTK
jgi:hypothetical protein